MAFLHGFRVLIACRLFLGARSSFNDILIAAVMLTGGAACSKMYVVFSDEVQSTARLDARRAVLTTPKTPPWHRDHVQGVIVE
jgi:hypothetical protein